MYGKIHKFTNSLEYYTLREWKFVNRNSTHLLDKMSAGDKALFPFDVRDLNWESYIQKYVLGIREHLLKDDTQTLPKARRNVNM